jgi:xylulokinase
MATQVGVTAHSSLLAAQMQHLRETKPDIWGRTSRVALASAFLCSILTGTMASFSESEAATTGIYSLSKEQWDESVLKIIAGSDDGANKVKSMLGAIERNAARPVAKISSYFSSKYGLDSGE